MFSVEGGVDCRGVYSVLREELTAGALCSVLKEE